MDKPVIYHNGECSKSKDALELLQECGVDFDVRWYLAEPLSRDELKALLKKLDMPAGTLIRKNEPVYKENFEGKELTEDQWLDALMQFPVLMERPVVEMGGKAIVARPPGKVLEFIKQ